MEFRKDLDGSVLTRSQVLKNENNPKPPTVETIEALGYALILEGQQPIPTSVYDTVERFGIKQESDGKWYTRYRLGPTFTDTKDDDGNVTSTAAQNEAAYKKKIDDNAAAIKRSERDKKLHDCDWTQAADTALASDKKAEWVTYRKALRDLPTSSGANWPHKVTFPTAPS